MAGEGWDEAEEPAAPEPVAPEPGAAPMPEAGRGPIQETLRKALLAGVGALFMTEEGARRLARDWKLPKEIVAYVVGQAGSAKDEVLRVVSEEVRKFFESEALRREFLRLITSMSVEVHAEISLKPAKGGKRVEPRLKVGAVKPRLRVREPEGEDPEGE